MNYESMSDFEINILVANAVNLELCEGQHYKPSAAYWQGTCKTFNPCNNPSDAWPIMLKNGIAPLAENGRVYGAATDTYEYYEPRGNVIYSCENENPLRAAMIVFLMMSES